MTIDVTEHASPIGRIVVAARGRRLCALEFGERWPRRRAWLERRFGAATFRRVDDAGGIARRLAAYFDGDLTALDRIAVDPGGTPFQQRVWTALRDIPPGRTTSYGELARAVGLSGAARAVGAANGANPVGIVIPCHRAIGTDGTLHGYAGGLPRKRWLLRHEGAAAVTA
jgi:methylated-DNA-[protein]-cysteine S-methyltransferase